MPSELDFEALCCAMVRKAANAGILNGMMLRVERVEQMLAVNDPVPAVGAPHD